VLLLKKLHVRENETLPLKLQKEVQPQGEESALPVRRKAALREKPLRERAALREKPLRERAALRNAAAAVRNAAAAVRNAAAAVRRKAALRNEEDNQSFALKNPFFFIFFNY
jgi:hypothetical protein